MKKVIYLTVLVFSAVLNTAVARASDYSAIVTFGDSLSDPGNYFALFGEQEIQPFEPDNIPNSPYAIGGHHFSNGETWIEQLSRMMQLPNDGSAAVLAPGAFFNYAVGRSRARDVADDEGVFNAEGLSSQVSRYLSDVGGQADPNALHVIWIGSNDIADAMFYFSRGDLASGSAIYQASLTNTLVQLETLYAVGARRFMVVGIPDFSLTPRLRKVINFVCNLNPLPFPDVESCIAGRLGNISSLSNGYSSSLNALAGFQLMSKGDVEYTFLDSTAFLQQIMANPEAVGISNTTDGCITPDTRQQALCGNANEYLFWDGQHPTKKGHKLLAEYAFDALH